jgi:Uma2 family endonuclease
LKLRRATRTAPLRDPDAPALFLKLPVGRGIRVSNAMFWRICAENRDWRLERTAKGELICMAPAGAESGGQNAYLTMRLGVWTQADGRGKFFDSSAGFKLPNGATRAPDASWILLERWLAVPPKERKRFAPICPDFVVELRSPTDSLPEVRAKMREYLEQGARLGWMIDPIDQKVEIYRPGRDVEVLDRPSSLSGEDVLPGFTLELQGILFD